MNGMEKVKKLMRQWWCGHTRTERRTTIYWASRPCFTRTVCMGCGKSVPDITSAEDMSGLSSAIRELNPPSRLGLTEELKRRRDVAGNQ